MTIAFIRLGSYPYPFKLNLDNIVFEGTITKKDNKLSLIEGTLKGFAYKGCDRCGCEIELEVDINVNLYASDGVFKDKENTLSDTMEFFDGNIDLIEVATSEIESYLSDYHYCNKCTNQ